MGKLLHFIFEAAKRQNSYRGDRLLARCLKGPALEGLRTSVSMVIAGGSAVGSWDDPY